MPVYVSNLEASKYCEMFEVGPRVRHGGSSRSKNCIKIFKHFKYNKALKINISVNHRKQKIFVLVAVGINATFVSILALATENCFKIKKVNYSEYLTFIVFWSSLLQAIFSTQLNLSLQVLVWLRGFKFWIKVSKDFQLNTAMLKISKSRKFEYVHVGKLFDKLCDGIEVINDTTAFYFILIFPL